MRTTAIKIFVIAIAFLIVLLLSALMHGGQGGLNPILAVGLLAFIAAVWKWKPKDDKEEIDKHTLNKD